MTIAICSRSALSALLGHPCACLWQTEVVGYDVTQWEVDQDGCHWPTRSRFVKTMGEAKRVEKQWKNQGECK